MYIIRLNLNLNEIRNKCWVHVMVPRVWQAHHVTRHVTVDLKPAFNAYE